MPSLRSTLEATVLRTLLPLPPSVVRRLAGRPVMVNGRTLSPELQLMMRLRALTGGRPFGTGALERERALIVAEAQVVGGDQPIASVRDLSVDGADGPIPARLYRPVRGGGQLPTLMFFHGGGMAVGDLDSHDAACRFLSVESGVQVLSVDYRLAPEHPFPAGVDDCAAAYRWLVGNAATIGADPDRLAVGGDSAGGYLAAVTALTAAEEGLPLRFQLLVYPVTDFVGESESRRSLGRGFFLEKASMDAFEAMYFADPEDRHDPRASIVRRETLPEGLAPALVVTAGFDPLSDEGAAYAALLADAGVPVEHRCYDSMIHSFFNMVGVGREAVSYNREIARLLGEALR